MPLFTVLLSRILFREKQTKSIYLSLVPIITGVLIASLTEFHFDMIGLVSALISTAGFSLQHIFSKRVLKRTGIHQFQLLATLGRLSLLMFSPIWFLVDGRRLITVIFSFFNIIHFLLSFSFEYLQTHPELHDPTTVIWLLAIDGFLNFSQNIIAFSILNLVTPLTYAVANATKRIAIIAVSILILRNPVSPTNVFGMLLAIIGVLLYNRAKYLENRHKSLLPTTVIKSDSNSNHLPATNGISSASNNAEFVL